MQLLCQAILGSIFALYAKIKKIITTYPLDKYSILCYTTYMIVKNPKAIAKIVNMRANGESFKSIGEELGVAHTTIAKIAKRPEVRDLISQTYDNLASLAPKVYDTYSEELTKKPRDIEERKLRFSVAKDLTGILGMSPVRDSQKNFFLTQILQPTQITLSPVVNQLLSAFSANLQALEAEIVEDSPV
jgi:hypothetical protein